MKNFLKKSYIKFTLIILATFSFSIAAADVLSESLWVDTGMCSGTDEKTGLTCDEISENPGQDVYYIVTSSHLDDDIWSDSHQDKETVRWDFMHTKFIVKYNASDIPRREFGLEKALGTPMNHDEILAYLGDPLNGFFDGEYYAEHPLVPPEEIVPLPEPEPTTTDPGIDPTILPEDPAPSDPTEPIAPEEPTPSEDPDVITSPDPTVGEVEGATDDASADENPPEESSPEVEESTVQEQPQN